MRPANHARTSGVRRARIPRATSGVVVSRTEIEQHIYDDAAELISDVIDAAVCVLRQKIDLPGRPSLIQTQRRVGYILLTGEA